MNQETLIECMVKKYAHCRTYQDAGTVETRLGKMTFKTCFVRPDKFRFEWCDLEPSRHAGRSVIWSDGANAFSHRKGVGEVEREENLDLAIAGATGVSGGSAHTISSLLMPHLRVSREGRSFVALGCFEFGNQEMIDGQSCVRLLAEQPELRSEVWLRTDDFAVIKLIEQHISTPKSDEQMLAALDEIDSKLMKEIEEYLKTQSEEDRVVISTTSYADIVFDREIAETVFSEAS